MQICKTVLHLILEIAVIDKMILKVLLQCAKSAIWSWSSGSTFGRHWMEWSTAGFTYREGKLRDIRRLRGVIRRRVKLAIGWTYSTNMKFPSTHNDSSLEETRLGKITCTT